MLLGTIDNMSDVAHLRQADIIACHVATGCELLQIVQFNLASGSCDVEHSVGKGLSAGDDFI